MSHMLVDDAEQPGSDQFASIPTADELAQRSKQAEQPAEPQAAPQSDEPDLPEKFRGKSVQEIVESYNSLESELGRQAQEVGSLRKLTDQLLEVGSTARQSQQQEPQDDYPDLTADDVLNDPRSAIQSVAQAEVGKANSRVDQIEAQLALRDFESRHPSFREDQTDPGFQAFAKGSSYRQRLAAKAAQGDLDAAEELWSAWDEQSSQGSADTTQEPTAKEQDALESAEAIATRGGAETNSQPQKFISRTDLAKIKLEDEERYYSESFQAYMTDMYRKGLVK